MQLAKEFLFSSSIAFENVLAKFTLKVFKMSHNQESEILTQSAQAAVIRKLIDCQPVGEYLIRLQNPWGKIAELIASCPNDKELRTQAFIEAITNLVDKKSIHAQVFDIDPAVPIARIFSTFVQPSVNPESILETLLHQPSDHGGHASCLIAFYTDKFLYCPDIGWLYYNGKNWSGELADQQLAYAIEATIKIRRILGKERNLIDFVKNCMVTKANIEGTRAILRSHVSISREEFDGDPILINCANGVVNLETGQLIPHCPYQRFTYCIPTEYDRQADVSQWIEFLVGALIRQTDRERLSQSEISNRLDYIQMVLGYSITGMMSEECLFYLYGPTRSGKGAFTQTIKAVFKATRLVAEVDSQTITSQRERDTQNFDLAMLDHCRIVIVGENRSDHKLNAQKLKQFTGRDEIWAARKFHDHSSYKPQFKVFLSSNFGPVIDPDDEAAWGRFRIIEFPNSHLGQEDKGLKDRFTKPEFLRGVLAWMVQGAIRWFSSTGLPFPDWVKQATQAKREEQDLIGQFIAEDCELIADSWISIEALYDALRLYCIRNGIEKIPSKNEMSMSLAAKSFEKSRKTSGGKQMRGFQGIQLIVLHNG